MVQDVPVQPEGLGLMRIFQLRVFHPPFSYGSVALQSLSAGTGTEGMWGCSGTLGRSFGMLECSQSRSRGNGREFINGISGDGAGAQIVIRTQTIPGPGAVPGSCPKAPGLG